MGNYRMRQMWAMVISGWLCVGCGVSPLQDEAATLVEQNRAYVTEAAEIRSTIAAQDISVMSTSVAAATTVARENGINVLLLETVRAGDPPTVQVVAQVDRSVGRLRGGTPDDSIALSGQPGGNVIDTYTTATVRDSDGCGVEQQFQFPAGTIRIFAVQEVQNIPAGTLVATEWYYNGAEALSDQLRVTTGADRLCIWFFVEPYSTGNWAVQFFQNGNPSGQRINFTVGESS